MSFQATINTYTSSNLRKHQSSNFAQRWLIERFHATAAALLVQANPRSILDAGCGEGIAMQTLLARQTGYVAGLDGSLGALQIAEHINPAKSFINGDLTGLPFPSDSFDLVVCMEVLEHLDQPERGLAELCRVSSRWLLLSVPHEPLFRGANFLRGKNMRAWGNDPGHVNHWTSRAFLRFVSRQCQVVACRRSFPWTLVLCRVV